MPRKAVKRAQYKILSIDPYLKPYYNDIDLRMQRHAETRRILLGDKADLSSFANGYLYYGIHRRIAAGSIANGRRARTRCI